MENFIFFAVCYSIKNQTAYELPKTYIRIIYRTSPSKFTAPSKEEKRRQMSVEFLELWNLSHVIGAIKL